MELEFVCNVLTLFLSCKMSAASCLLSHNPLLLPLRKPGGGRPRAHPHTLINQFLYVWLRSGFEPVSPTVQAEDQPTAPPDLPLTGSTQLL